MAKRLYYFTNERVPSQSACTIQQMNMCEAFADCGYEVTFVRPFYLELAKSKTSDIFEYYQVKQNFKIRTLFTLLSLSKPRRTMMNRGKVKLAFIGGLSMVIVTWCYAFLLLLKGSLNSDTIIFSRNLNAALVFLKFRRVFKRASCKVIFEAHSLSQPRRQSFFTQVLQQADVIVAITETLKNAIVEKYTIEPVKVIVQPDGINAQRVQHVVHKQNARNKINIPYPYENLIVYTGQIIAGKGVKVFIKAASYFDERTIFVVVGGTPQSIDEIKLKTDADKLHNLFFTGFVLPADVVYYQAAADVLVLPNTQSGFIHEYTSPLKLFEYMASKRPIVASNLPVFHEILQHEKNALLVEPGNEIELANSVKQLLSDSELGYKLCKNAFEKVSDYTWEKRALKIAEFVESL